VRPAFLEVWEAQFFVWPNFPLVRLVTRTIFSGADTVFLQEIAGLMNWDYDIGIMVLVLMVVKSFP